MPFALSQISFCHSNRKIIDDISIALAPGKFHGIIGPNGCGKTTLLDLLTKHHQPSSGSIRYNGKMLSSYSKKELSKEIALVPQNFYINFPFTVKEIVMMGRYPHIPRFAAPAPRDLEIVREVMERTDIFDFSDRYVTELSSGERQRVIFARALAQSTPVLMLDEATSNLDINFTINLMNITEQKVKKGGHTVIAVLQDINLAATYCDYLIFMGAGRIVEHGPTQTVLNPTTLRSVFNIDAKVYRETYSESLQVVFRK